MTNDLFGDAIQARREPTPRPQRAKLKRSKKAAPRNAGKRRNTSVSRLLENAALSLRIAGFVVYDNYSQFRVAHDRGTLPRRYLVEHYPHPALYGGKGFKEGYISHNGTEYIFEAKWQNTSGSVDEKVPYLWEHFLASNVYTPRRYLDAAVQVMGAIDLDPASSAAAQKHVKAARWFTRETDGLAQQWVGRVFLNPPYAMPYIKQFASKLIESWRSGDISEGIFLTNNATDTEWFHNTLDACGALCLTKGRIQFLQARDGELTEKASPTHGQTFFYFGPNIEAFAEIFGEFGTILRRYQRPTKLKVAA